MNVIARPWRKLTIPTGPAPFQQPPGGMPWLAVLPDYAGEGPAGFNTDSLRQLLDCADRLIVTSAGDDPRPSIAAIDDCARRRENVVFVVTNEQRDLEWVAWVHSIEPAMRIGICTLRAHAA